VEFAPLLLRGTPVAGNVLIIKTGHRLARSGAKPHPVIVKGLLAQQINTGSDRIEVDPNVEKRFDFFAVDGIPKVGRNPHEAVEGQTAVIATRSVQGNVQEHPLCRARSLRAVVADRICRSHGNGRRSDDRAHGIKRQVQAHGCCTGVLKHHAMIQWICMDKGMIMDEKKQIVCGFGSHEMQELVSFRNDCIESNWIHTVFDRLMID